MRIHASTCGPGVGRGHALHYVGGSPSHCHYHRYCRCRHCRRCRFACLYVEPCLLVIAIVFSCALCSRVVVNIIAYEPFLESGFMLTAAFCSILNNYYHQGKTAARPKSHVYSFPDCSRRPCSSPVCALSSEFSRCPCLPAI